MDYKEKLKAISAQLPSGEESKKKTAQAPPRKKTKSETEEEQALQEWAELFGTDYAPRKDGVLQLRPKSKNAPQRRVYGTIPKPAAGENENNADWAQEVSGKYRVGKNGIRILENEPQATAVKRRPVEPEVAAPRLVVVETFDSKALLAYLAQSKAALVRLAFARIEQLCCGRLPAVAFRSRSWWNSDNNSENARLWSGYIVTAVTTQEVEFCRLANSDVADTARNERELAMARQKLSALQSELDSLKNQPVAASNSQNAKPDNEKIAQLQAEVLMLNDIITSNAMASRQHAESLVPRGVLVIGATPLAKNIIQALAREAGFASSQIELHDDYAANKRYDFNAVRNSRRFGAVIIGPNAHKVTGLGDYSSVLQKLRGETGYPRVFECRTLSGELKSSKQALQQAFAAVREYFDVEICD